MLSEIVGERTSTKLLQIQTQKEFKTMEDFLDNKLNEVDEQQFKIVENQITLNNELDESTEFIHNFIKEFLEKKSEFCLIQTFFSSVSNRFLWNEN